jgi:hypothetical protein
MQLQKYHGDWNWGASKRADAIQAKAGFPSAI